MCFFNFLVLFNILYMVYLIIYIFFNIILFNIFFIFNIFIYIFTNVKEFDLFCKSKNNIKYLNLKRLKKKHKKIT